MRKKAMNVLKQVSRQIDIQRTYCSYQESVGFEHTSKKLKPKRKNFNDSPARLVHVESYILKFIVFYFNRISQVVD